MQMLRTLFAKPRPEKTLVAVKGRALTMQERRDNHLTGGGWRRTVFHYDDGSVQEGVIVRTVSRATALALTKI